MLLLSSCLMVVGQNMQLITYKASNGVEYKKGAAIYFGPGSAQDRSFKFVDSNYAGANGSSYLPSSYAGQFMKVRKIRQMGTKKSGYKIYLVCSSGPKNYWVEIEAAIEAGEVVVP